MCRSAEWYRSPVRRTLVLLIVVLCAVQSTQLIAFIAPDDCLELSSGGNQGEDDDCPTQCARCLCCARRPLPVPEASVHAPDAQMAPSTVPVDLLVQSSGSPQDVFHVPRTS